MMVRAPGHVPSGFRWFISPQRPQLLHLSTDGSTTLCGLRVRSTWQEPTYTQRTKCRPCWLARAA